MYEAKNDGRNQYRVYSHTMGNYIDKQLNLEQELTQAVKNKKEIEVYYQAKIDAQTQEVVGAEALVRWHSSEHGVIFPDDFIHIAESTGLMVELGNIIIDKSIALIQELNNSHNKTLTIAINLSARQFQDSSLVPFVLKTLKKYHIDSSQIEFEITESISMSNLSNTLRILSELKDIGISVAIDDFGTGHSSLSYLKKFPIDVLKIDKSFVDGIIDEEEDRVIAQTIITMAHSLGLKTVAEGVETQEHVNMLQTMECDILQGYFYSKPVPKNKFINFLKEYKINN
jgi:EAL domain-containing protein (putative c-di-GMP-specific phosphodiesterase class I)